MDVLKVKVNGQWVGIPSIRGEKGSQGDPGTPGQDGQDGQSAYVYIRYAANHPTSDSDMKTEPDAWMGMCSGRSSTAPTHYTDYAWYKIKGETGAAGQVQDVQVNGTSVLLNGVANIPVASANDYGVAKPGLGLKIYNNSLAIDRADASLVKAGINENRPIVPFNQHSAVFYALAKLAGVDLASVQNVTVGQWPDNALVAIQKMLGLYESPWELINEVTTTQNQTEIVINTDSYGEAFELTDLICLFDAGPSTTGNRDSFYGQVSFKNLTTGGANAGSFPSLAYPTSTSSMGAKIEIGINDSKAPYYARTITAVGDGNTQNMQAMAKKSIVGPIVGIRIYQANQNTSLIPSGATMKLYGKRKWTA